MQFSVTFRHMEATEALKTYAKEKLGRIKKYFPDPISVNIVMSTERGYNHRCDVTMQLHNGLTVAGHEATENMYSSIDLVTAKIERQVRRYKDKLRSHKGRAAAIEPVAWSHSVVAEPQPESEASSSGGDADQSAASANPGPVVVKTEQLTANAMSVEEAIMQMNLLHQTFFVFRHADTGAVNVVYRRDGEENSYGVIETASQPKA